MDLEQFENLVERAHGVHQHPDLAPFVIEQMTGEVKPLEHLQDAPDRIKRALKHETAGSFIAYANTWKTEHSELFASLTRRVISITVDAPVPPAAASWGDHKAGYSCPESRQWQAWTKADRSRMSQLEFAEWLEDHAEDVTRPPGADLLDLALNLQLHRKAEFRSSVRLESGEFSFAYSEQDQGHGNVQIPAAFDLGIPVFHGGQAYTVHARLRYRLDAGKLTLWFELIEPGKYVEDAFDEVLAEIETATNMTAYRIV